MSEFSKRNLQLINSEDQFQEQVWEVDGETISDTIGVRTKLLFFLNWQHKTQTRIVLPTGFSIKAQLGCDPDESEPSCLWANLTNDDFSTLLSLQVATLIVTIFRATYRMRVAIIDRENTRLYLELPQTLEILGTRATPRRDLSEDEKKQLGTASWCSAGGEIKQIELQSIGVRNLMFMASDLRLNVDESGTLTIGKFIAKAKCLKAHDSIFICELDLPDSEYHKYFELYASVQYPKLQTRKHHSENEVYELYKASGYFGQFGDTESAKSEITSTWNDLSNSDSFENIDYIAQDSKQNPIGASSLTKAFFHGRKPYWAFHQLCALRREEEISTTGLLYSWRADYLLGLSEDSSALVWFRSRSRFIEKIYSKLARLRPDRIKLSPIHLVKGSVAVDGKSQHARSRTAVITFGNRKRICSQFNSIASGYGPRWLNTSGLLNCVFTLSDEDSPDLFFSQASHLLQEYGVTSSEFYFSFLKEPSDSRLGPFTVCESDRLCVFSKSSLTDLLASIDHGIAIAEKKKDRA